MPRIGTAPLYERPIVKDFGSLWANTFMNNGGHMKMGSGEHMDAFMEHTGQPGS